MFSKRNWQWLPQLWRLLSQLLNYLLTKLPEKGLAPFAFLILLGYALYYLFWSDSALGDRQGWYGILLGTFGLWYTIWQLHKTREVLKEAANAATKATEEAIRQADKQAYLLLLEKTRDYIRSARNSMNDKNWKIACVRLHDAADELRVIHQNNLDSANTRFSEAAKTLDGWGALIKSGTDGETLRGFNSPKSLEWVDDYNKILNYLEFELGESR